MTSRTAYGLGWDGAHSSLNIGFRCPKEEDEKLGEKCQSKCFSVLLPPSVFIDW